MSLALNHALIEVEIEDACDRNNLSAEEREFILARFRSDPGELAAQIESTRNNRRGKFPDEDEERIPSLVCRSFVLLAWIDQMKEQVNFIIDAGKQP